MLRILKALVVTVVLAVLLLGLGLFAAHRWLGTDDFRGRVQQQVSEALGVPFTLARIEVAVWPLPAVALTDAAVQTQPPLTLGRVEVRPLWRALLQGRLALSMVRVRQAVLPQAGMDALLESLQKKKQENEKTRGPKAEKPDDALIADLLPQQAELEDVTWVSAKGSRSTVDAQARLGADGLPVDAKVSLRHGPLQGAGLMLHRQGLATAWDVVLDVAGGQVKGLVQLQGASAVGQPFVLQGKLETRGVAVAVLAGGDKGPSASPLSGQLEASTTLKASTARVADLADVLQTQSTFTVRQAVLHGIDLARAVRTVGLSRGGETRLDTLAGQIQTQGLTVHLRNLVASSGALSATGNVSLAPSRALSGQVSVNLAAEALGSAVGVPLVVGGTLAAPEVTLTRAAMVGAAVGTLVMPGVGTGAGASLGERVSNGVKKIFGK